jgi:hypothetical protein
MYVPPPPAPQNLLFDKHYNPYFAGLVLGPLFICAGVLGTPETCTLLGVDCSTPGAANTHLRLLLLSLTIGKVSRRSGWAKILIPTLGLMYRALMLRLQFMLTWAMELALTTAIRLLKVSHARGQHPPLAADAQATTGLNQALTTWPCVVLAAATNSGYSSRGLRRCRPPPRRPTPWSSGRQRWAETCPC